MQSYAFVIVTVRTVHGVLGVILSRICCDSLCHWVSSVTSSPHVTSSTVFTSSGPSLAGPTPDIALRRLVLRKSTTATGSGWPGKDYHRTDEDLRFLWYNVWIISRRQIPWLKLAPSHVRGCLNRRVCRLGGGLWKEDGSAIVGLCDGKNMAFLE